jgi:hypothetical protein
MFNEPWVKISCTLAGALAGPLQYDELLSKGIPITAILELTALVGSDVTCCIDSFTVLAQSILK